MRLHLIVLVCCVHLFTVADPGRAEQPTKKNQPDPKTLEKLKADVQKAKEAIKKAEAAAAERIEAAEAKRKKAFEEYRKSIAEGFQSRRKAGEEYRKALRALHSFGRGQRAGAPKKPMTPAKPPERQELEDAITKAREAIRAAQKNWHQAVRALHEHRRKNIRSKDPTTKKQLQELTEAVSMASEAIKTANDNWFKAVKARNEALRKPMKKP